ncbi:MAG: protein translocase subunit SecD [bacterium (Candidatus Ratteibacteria) CG_4_10_14_3_um_filter_41_18]|uniref:Protein translocase subunit SecD n=1 Tax=bacterium (Candidatus Ratteibacteria) CG_4_10_14_3_um_filter_41_18 TaxID=2014287 RepID=A0A2M7M2L1_9BACT|nr:MAG: protein translocase subunit SecD [bacterium (Candidatus Ratteibacteria) CG_4_10_14_3_um_filter_41_18]
MKTISYKILFVLAIIGVCVWQVSPLSKKIKLGLDLLGGMQLMLQVEKTNLEEKAVTDSTDRALEIIRNRIDALGVTEPVIQKAGEDCILIQLPGIKDPERAIEIIGKTALLEFKLVDDDNKLLDQALSGNVPEGYEVAYLVRKDERGIRQQGPALLLKKEAELNGSGLKDAYIGIDSNGFPEVRLEFNREGAKKFARVTGTNIEKRLAIVLDGRVQSAPVIKDCISGGKAQITGRFTMDEAKDLAIVLRAGALPAKLSIIQKRIVGPSLGRDSIRKGATSAFLGTILVLLFMVIYYAGSGMIANFALFINILIIFAVLAFFKATLTLPGIAGIALTIGMAVDANVLIFERIREELKIRKTIRSSIDAGYERALVTIVDSNLTTVIAAFILFLFGTGSIKGFGLTLTVGILANIFTAVFVTKLLFDFICSQYKMERISI